MLIGEIVNKIRYKVENILVKECSNSGLDTALAAMVAELIHKDIQMMANEYMTNKIWKLSEDLEKSKKEPDNGTVSSEADDCKNGGTKSDKKS